MSESQGTGDTPNRARAAFKFKRAAPDRLVWLDIVRLLCALMILGIHWLRACFKVGLFGTHDPVNLVIDYQGQSKGLGMLRYVFIAGTGHSPWIWLTNAIGLLGGFGWEGVSALIIVSGFSLTVAMKSQALTPTQWLGWVKKRVVRILVPFYLVAIPFLFAYVGLLVIVSRMHGTFAIGLNHKLHTLMQTPPLGVVLSHTLLFDPFERNWQPDFFAPAWWFIPAILVAYLIYPLILGSVRRMNGLPALAVTATLSVAAYALAGVHILVNEDWYFIALQESFNLTLGVVAGSAWLDANKRFGLEKVIFGSWTFPIALLVFIIGNLANWEPVARPFASIFYGPGLTLMITVIAKRVENWRVARIAIKVDAYDLYLVHQPFAFPLALASKIALHNYAVFAGWFVFVGVTSLGALTLAFVQRLAFRRPPPVRQAVTNAVTWRA